MRQQVNLLSEELKPKVQPMTIGQLMAAWVALVGVLTVVSGGDGASLWQLATQHEDTQNQWQVLHDANSLLKAGVSEQADPALRLEVEDLRERRAEQRRLMDLLFGYKTRQTDGFSPYLNDLAEYRVDGMWLQRITLDAGGARIHLNGRTTDPKVLPQFLKRLSLGDSFRGHRFHNFELKESDQGLLEFDISNFSARLAPDLGAISCAHSLREKTAPDWPQFTTQFLEPQSGWELRGRVLVQA